MKTVVKAYLSVLVILTCCLALGCSSDYEGEEEMIIMEIVIFPTGTFDSTYYFSIDGSAMLSCSIGTRKTNDVIISDTFEKITKNGHKQLAAEELQYLVDKAEELQASGYRYEKKVVKDSWHFVLSYNDNIYEMDGIDKEPESLRKIIDEIIRISPLPVDLHDWA